MTEHSELDQGLWLSVTELAKRKGVGKSTISEKISRLVGQGLLTVKSGGKGAATLVNLAQYDLAVGEVGDGAKEAGAATKALKGKNAVGRGTDHHRFRDEQTREKAYAADLKFIELERARGNLIEVAEFDVVASEAAARIGEILDGVEARDSELTAIALKEGENGMRRALRRIAREQRIAAAQAMRDMAAAAKTRAAQTAGLSNTLAQGET